MIVIKSPDNVHQAIIVEAAQPVGKTKEWYKRGVSNSSLKVIILGVLVYAVDASVADGMGPIEVVCTHPSKERDKCSERGYKYNAVLTPGITIR